MRIGKTLTLALGLAAAAAVPAYSTFTPPAQAQVRCAVANPDAGLDGEEQAALDMINEYRARSGIGPLAVSRSLNRAAQWKSESMAGGTPFAHDDGFRSWMQRVRECGYTYSTWVRENIAAGNEGAAATVSQWINSAPHRDNLLDPSMRVIGIARRPGGTYGWYWTANLADSAADVVDGGSRE